MESPKLKNGATHRKGRKNGSESVKGGASEQSDGNDSSTREKLEDACEEKSGRGRAPG